MSGQLGELVVSLSADIARFREDMGKATKLSQDSANAIAKSFDGVQSAIGGIGKGFAAVTSVLAGGAMFKDMISTTKNVFAEVTQLSKGFGITSEQASILRVALGGAFLTADQAVAASDRLTRQSIKNSAAFKALGIDVHDDNGHMKDSLTIMTEVNAYLSTLKEGKERDMAAMTLYGKGWRELSGILRLTTEGMAEAKRRAEELHLIFGDEGKAAMKKYKESMHDIQEVHESFKVQVGASLIPALTQIATAFNGVSTGAVGAFGDALSWSMEQLEISGRHIRRFIDDMKVLKNPFAFATKEGRAEIVAELDANEQMLNYSLAKIGEKYGRIVKARKPDPGGNNAPDLTSKSESDKNAAAEKELEYLKAVQEKKLALVISGNQLALEKNRESYIAGYTELKAYLDEKYRLEQASLTEEVDIRKKELKDAQEMQKKVEDSKVFVKNIEDIEKETANIFAAKTKVENATKALNQAVAQRDMAALRSTFEGNQEINQAASGHRNLMSGLNVTGLNLDNEGYQAQAETLKNNHLNELEDLKQKSILTVEQKNAAMLKADENYAKAKKKLDIDTAKTAIASVGDSLTTIGNALMKGNKEQFEAGKKVAIAGATVQMLLGAVNAYTSMLTIPIVGPGLGALASAAVVTAGMMNIAQIEAQQFPARALGGPVLSNTSYLVGEHGPEIFTPGASGQITSNDKLNSLGGTSASVTQVFQISTGVSDTVRAEIGRMLPLIKQHAVAAVKQSMYSGGFQGVPVWAS